MKATKFIAELVTSDLYLIDDRGETETLPGGKFMAVAYFLNPDGSKTYITDQEYKPGVPQLIPESLVASITEVKE